MQTTTSSLLSYNDKDSVDIPLQLQYLLLLLNLVSVI
jgi:hypothetical protein